MPDSSAAHDRPCISVIVPFFDSKRHLARCIDSLLAQRDVGGMVEIILVDNRSTDGSSEIARRYPQLVVLAESTPGAYAARNTGIRRSRAPLVAFTDADCSADPDWLRSARDAMDDPQVAVAVGHCRYPTDASWALGILAAYENARTDYVLRCCPPAYHFAYANNMVVRASVFAELGPFEEWKRAADTELVHRLASRRPDLRLVYQPSMRVTHHEFGAARDRVRRLSLYTTTNAKIESFRELDPGRRLGLLRFLLRRRC